MRMVSGHLPGCVPLRIEKPNPVELANGFIKCTANMVGCGCCGVNADASEAVPEATALLAGGDIERG